MINAPIPGMSLTGEPKKYNWERPPELVAPEDVAEYYLDKLSDKETMRGILDTLLTGDITLVSLVEGIMRIGVSRGLHTIDAGLTVAPLIHKTIKVVADNVGIDYEEGLIDKKGKEENEKTRRRLLTKKALERMPKDATISEEEISPVKDNKMEEPQKGLISRRTK